MSVRTDTVNLNININGNKAQNEMNNLRKKAADVKFEMDGLKKGTAEYIAKSKELSQVTAQMTALKKEIGITALNQKELIAELSKLKALRGSVIPFSNEYKELSKSIKEVENRLYNVKNGVQGFASFFSKIKDEVKQFGIVAASYLGFQFLTSQFTNIIRGAGKLSDQLADLQRVAGLTATEAKNLNSQFKELNTRTTTEGLREIAIIAGKLGVAKDDIFEFTKAVDQLVVALGDELGDAEQITNQLGKIVKVFNGDISAEGITHLGNAFVQLANTGAATGGFIADFDQRLSGIAKSAGISLGALSGLGAGLEEMGGRVESSATAIQKLVIHIAQDIPAAAKIAGQTTKEFETLFKLDPTEALLKYSQGLVKNKQSFAEVTAAFKDAGEEGARTIETISKLGTGADQLRKRIDLGKKSIQESSAITEAFALKNETFGATLDKLGKEFNRLVTSPGVTNFLKGAVEGALAFVKAIRDIPKFVEENRFALLTLAAGILLLNRQYIISAALLIKDTFLKGENIVATKIQAFVTGVATAAQRAYAIATLLLTGKINLATAAQLLWFNAIKLGLGPIGWIITAVGALAVGLTVLIGKNRGLTAEMKASIDLQKEAAQAYGDQVNNIERLKKILTDETASLQLKKEAYKQLIALHPEFEKTLILDEQGHLQGKAAIDEYIKGLKNKAEAQAAATLSNKLYQEILEKEESISRINKTYGASEIRKRQKEVQELMKQKEYFDNIITKSLTPAPAATGGGRSGRPEGYGTNTSNSNDAAAITAKTIATIKAQLGDLDKAYENIDISNKKALKSNRDARKELQDQLDALEGKKSPGQKSDDSQYKRLKAEAEKFYKEVQALKKRIDKGDTPEEQEVQQVTQKYEELLLRAKDYYIKKATDSKRFGEEEKIIEEQKQRELNEIFQKYFKQRLSESASKEYDESLAARSEFSDQLKIAAAKDYADGKISKIQYEQTLKQIEKDETHDRIIIAQEYSETVKKAATDVKNFRKKEEEQTTQDAVKQAEARVQLSIDEENAKLRRAVLTTRPGSKANLDARKNELKKQEKDEVKAAKEKQAALGIVIDEGSQIIMEIRDRYAKQEEELDQSHLQSQIDKVLQYVNYVQQALTGLNQLINNRENQQFNKEKALNNKKRQEFKRQLDHKLISQAQYDKKMNGLQEEQDAKERELKRKQAKREKQLMLFRAIVSTAAAVAQSLTLAWPLNLVMAVITGALGAIEIAAIANQPLPEAGKGKWFTQGDKHSDASGGIPIMIERDEAVIKADAMTDKKEYLVRGTPAQITGALNAQAGGPNWAGGAIIKKMSFLTDRPAQVNPSLPTQLAEGGFANRGNRNQNVDSDSLLSEMKFLRSDVNGLRNDMNNWQTSIKAHVVFNDIKEKEKTYDTVKNLSGMRDDKLKAS